MASRARAAWRVCGADVIDQAGVTDVIVLEGINDVGVWHANASQIIAGLKRMIAVVHRAHLRIQLGTITPATGAGGYYGCTAADTIRQQVNRWIRTQTYSDGVVDFDKAVRDPSHPTRIQTPLDCGDHLHYNVAGYKALASAVNPSMLARP